MKTFKQAHEVLKDAQNFHLDMAGIYRHMQENTEDKRTKLLLEHLHEHELRMANNLKNYGAVAEHKVMQTWLQYTPEESASHLVKNLYMSDKPSLEEVNKLGQEVDRYFSDLYHSVYESIESEEVKDVFDNLKQIQDKERITLSKATNSLWDM
ncbi:hypothetical protein [Microbulbifer aggregans]|uniref:hypothetical protein n=1 Tax=Microbulbifer aggregans TaxID=1769779 RepID=UPI001CFF3A30|nr:hypothetical protein [Microbulbifer aggregans]